MTLLSFHPALRDLTRCVPQTGLSLIAYNLGNP
jgi:hypothetical protein